MVSFGFPAKVNICVVAGQPNAIVLHTFFVTFGLLLFSCQIEDISDTIFHKLFFAILCIVDAVSCVCLISMNYALLYLKATSFTVFKSN